VRTFLMTLLACSITMSILALIYMIVTPLLEKRYSRKWLYYSWLVIVVGLVIPFRPHFEKTFIRIDIPNDTEAYYAVDALPFIRPENTISVFSENSIGIAESSPGKNDQTPATITWYDAFAILWLAGVFVVLALHITRHSRFNRLTRRWSEDITDREIQFIWQSLKKEMGISKQILLQKCELAGSPLLTGILHPRILLPKTDIPFDELALILKHELVHFKRKDLWYKGAVLFVTAIHWFNPVIYHMARAINLQCESSCDYEVIKNKDADTRLKYSEAIVCAIRRTKPATVLSTALYGGNKDMKNRITSILDTNKKRTGVVILCAAFLLTLGTGLAFAAGAVPLADNRGEMMNIETPVAIIPTLESAQTTPIQENPPYIENDDTLMQTSELASPGNLREIYDIMSDYIAREQIDAEIILAENENSVRIIFNNNVFFEPASTVVRPDAYPMLDALIKMFKEVDHLFTMLMAEGHTDSTPINTVQYPSNWHISVFRAVNILAYIWETGEFDSTKLAAIGYGETKPIAPNDTTQGMERNNRMEFVVEV